MDLKDFKLLMVGAGGIGCELLKNLVLSGFTNIEVIDLDTIELSNLNRQFLFQKCHVGKPKAIIARESVLRYNPDANIVAHHDSIMDIKYDVEYFKQFSLVLNALDNKTARSHVNRLCLAAEVSLIESGSGGYLGQVTLIKKGLTECYDCLPKPAAKTFPGCTIRNTPSEPIHCIVWAKHLFNQLFGAEDPDEAVSPDGEDPENMADAGKTTVEKNESEEAVTRVSTRQWAKETSYNSEKLFNKLFGDDIKYLLSMAKLWEKRKAPSPLVWENCITDTTLLNQQPNGQETNGAAKSTADEEKLESHKVLTMKKYCELFKESVDLLKKRLEESNGEEHQILVWDKDDNDAMNFVTAASNLRCHIFSIGPKSQFETKSLAGNIIPAIATTNAIVAGLIVIQALKVLKDNLDACKTVYVRDKPSNNKVIVGTELVKPNDKCYVCASKPEVTVKLNINATTIKQFETKILKQELSMVQPDVEIDDGSGRIIISSEPGETEENNDKFLSHFGITNMMTLKCDDFFQNYELRIILLQCDTFEEGNTKEYELVSGNQLLKDLQAGLQKDKEMVTESPDVITDEKKRTYEAAFDGEEKSTVETTVKKPRRSEEAAEGMTTGDVQNESEIGQEDESNSINDASDALSEEEEENQVVSSKSTWKKPHRETIIDDDIIIEENSNDFKTAEEMNNQNGHMQQQVQQQAQQQPPQANEDSNTDDSDIIECSSTGSDIIEINDDENVHSDSSFVSIKKTVTNTNGHVLNGSNNSTNIVPDTANCNDNLVKTNKQCQPILESSNENNENSITHKTTENSDDDCITLIE